MEIMLGELISGIIAEGVEALFLFLRQLVWRWRLRGIRRVALSGAGKDVILELEFGETQVEGEGARDRAFGMMDDELMSSDVEWLQGFRERVRIVCRRTEKSLAQAMARNQTAEETEIWDRVRELSCFMTDLGTRKEAAVRLMESGFSLSGLREVERKICEAAQTPLERWRALLMLLAEVERNLARTRRNGARARSARY